MKKRDCQTGIEISDADWQRFEKFLPEPEASPGGGLITLVTFLPLPR